MGSDWESCFGVGNSGEDMFYGDYRHQDEKNVSRTKSYNESDNKYSNNNSKNGHTYDKWLELGYQVKKGQKAAYKYYGNSIFTRSQVTKI